MQFVFERVSEPDLEPVTLAWLKRELEEFEDVTERDDDITSKGVAAREWLEDFTGRAMVDQTWRMNISHGTANFENDPMRGYYVGAFAWQRVGEILLRRSPVLSITSFVSVDSDGTQTTIDASTYELRDAASKWPRLVAKSGATWTGAQDLRITFRAGYADRTGSPIQDASVIPERYKQAIILYTRYLYDGDAKDARAAEALVRTERVHHGFA